MMNKGYHTAVMESECIAGLHIHSDGVYVDATMGGAGHSKAILAELGPNGRLFCFDKDLDAAKNVPEDERCTFIPQDFRYLKNFLRVNGVKLVDGILADLGVSSHQFDTAERGFSTRFDAELDMRMHRKGPLTAATVINEYDLDRLARLFKIYGELRNAVSVARAITVARAVEPIATVSALKAIVAPLAPRQRENAFYARIFQSVRIEVNDELGALKALLAQSVEMLKTGGRMVVLSYHSLEDRLVKQFFKEGKFGEDADRDFFGNRIVPFKPLLRKPGVPTDLEIEQNPRSRSAKLRIAERI